MSTLSSRAFAVMLTALAVSAPSMTAGAQARGQESTAARSRQNQEVGGFRGRQNRRGDSSALEQQALVRRLRQAFAGVVRRELKLSDEKFAQFQRVDRDFQQRRGQLQRDETAARLALRSAMADTSAVDQEKIADYLTQLTVGQRRRAELLEAEQKELATFLTPLQRAKLQGLREQLAQRVQQLRQQLPAGRRGRP